ncbi:MAG: hypothetical protein V5A31_12720 [Haloferacaceae archaeon]|jgi:hypothetical protein
MTEERYRDEYALTGDQSISPGNTFYVSYTFPDAGAVRVTVEEFGGQIVYFCVSDEENARRYLNRGDVDGFEAEVAGEIPVDAEASTIETYLKPGSWYVLVQNPADNRPANGRLEVVYVH